MRILTGLALGSGGARGWCHIGVLRALDDLGIVPDVVAGSSMGALVGAAYCAGKLDGLERFARDLTRRRFAAMTDVRLSGGGLVAGQAILDTLQQLGIEGDIADLPIPFLAVATDLRTGREIWQRSGDVAEAVRASVALPGVICPQERDGRLLLDGGLTNPVPVSAARALGAEMIIAVNPNARPNGVIWEAPKPEGTILHDMTAGLPNRLHGAITAVLGNRADPHPAPGYLEVLSASIDVMTEQIRRARLAGDPPDVLIDPDLTGMSVLDFHRAAVAVDAGRSAVAADAEVLRRLNSR